MKHRLFWDFHGPRAARVAAHHATHLREFLAKHAIEGEAGVEAATASHHVAWCRVAAADGPVVHRALRSHRAEEEP